MFMPSSDIVDEAKDRARLRARTLNAHHGRLCPAERPGTVAGAGDSLRGIRGNRAGIRRGRKGKYVQDAVCGFAVLYYNTPSQAAAAAPRRTLRSSPTIWGRPPNRMSHSLVYFRKMHAPLLARV